jgi:hypothetical protein
MFVAKLDQGEVELQFPSRHPNNLYAKLRRYVGSKIGILWFNTTNGEQVVKIRQLDNSKPTVAHRRLNNEPPKTHRKTKQKIVDRKRAEGEG